MHATAKSFMTEGKVHPDPVGTAQNHTFTLLFKKRGGKVACYSIGFWHNYAGVLEVNGSDSSRFFFGLALNQLPKYGAKGVEMFKI